MKFTLFFGLNFALLMLAFCRPGLIQLDYLNNGSPRLMSSFDGNMGAVGDSQLSGSDNENGRLGSNLGRLSNGFDNANMNGYDSNMRTGMGYDNGITRFGVGYGSDISQAGLNYGTGNLRTGLNYDSDLPIMNTRVSQTESGYGSNIPRIGTNYETDVPDFKQNYEPFHLESYPQVDSDTRSRMLRTNGNVRSPVNQVVQDYGNEISSSEPRYSLSRSRNILHNDFHDLSNRYGLDLSRNLQNGRVNSYQPQLNDDTDLRHGELYGINRNLHLDSPPDIRSLNYYQNPLGNVRSFTQPYGYSETVHNNNLYNRQNVGLNDNSHLNGDDFTVSSNLRNNNNIGVGLERNNHFGVGTPYGAPSPRDHIDMIDTHISNYGLQSSDSSRLSSHDVDTDNVNSGSGIVNSNNLPTIPDQNSNIRSNSNFNSKEVDFSNSSPPVNNAYKSNDVGLSRTAFKTNSQSNLDKMYNADNLNSNNNNVGDSKNLNLYKSNSNEDLNRLYRENNMGNLKLSLPSNNLNNEYISNNVGSSRSTNLYNGNSMNDIGSRLNNINNGYNANDIGSRSNSNGYNTNEMGLRSNNLNNEYNANDLTSRLNNINNGYNANNMGKESNNLNNEYNSNVITPRINNMNNGYNTNDLGTESNNLNNGYISNDAVSSRSSNLNNGYNLNNIDKTMPRTLNSPQNSIDVDQQRSNNLNYGYNLNNAESSRLNSADSGYNSNNGRSSSPGIMNNGFNLNDIGSRFSNNLNNEYSSNLNGSPDTRTMNNMYNTNMLGSYNSDGNNLSGSSLDRSSSAGQNNYVLTETQGGAQQLPNNGKSLQSNLDPTSSLANSNGINFT